MNVAVFLDRDGTIAKDVPYCSHPEDFELLPKAGEGIRLLNESGFKVIIITNQSGIARGYFDEEMLEKIHRKMREDLAKFGAKVDAIYYCPHHPDDGCECRKPNTGLLEQAAREMELDLTKSYLIGDKLLDVTAAKNAGCKAIVVPSNESESSLLCGPPPIDIELVFCPDLYTAASWIVAQADSALHSRDSV